MYIILIGIVLRILFAYFNAFHGPLLGADADAIRFHDTAIAISEGTKNFNMGVGWVYASILGIIYKYSFDSIFFGSLFSILAWLISAIILLKLIKILKIESSYKNLILILYSLWPSVLIFSSVTLREPFQLLFFNLAILSFLKIFVENKAKYSFLFFLSLILLSYLHKVFVIYSGIFALFYFLFYLKLLRIQKIYVLLAIFSIIVFLIYLNFGQLLDYFYSKVPLDQKHFFEILEIHINNMTKSRASYQVERVIIFNYQDFLNYILTSTKNYFLQPTPTNQELFIDFMLYCENLIRLIIIFFILFKLLNVNMGNYRVYLALSIVLFSSEIGWALGTNNWGTAVRHHIPSFGLLFVLAFFNYNNSKN